MDLDPDMWDNKTITSGLKNYLRSARPTIYLSDDSHTLSAATDSPRMPAAFTGPVSLRK